MALWGLAHFPHTLPATPHRHSLKTQAPGETRPRPVSALCAGPQPHPPAVHDGRVVLPVLLLPQHDERLLGADPSTLRACCGGSRQRLQCLRVELWAGLCLRATRIRLLLCTLGKQSGETSAVTGLRWAQPFSIVRKHQDS